MGNRMSMGNRMACAAPAVDDDLYGTPLDGVMLGGAPAVDDDLYGTPLDDVIILGGAPAVDSDPNINDRERSVQTFIYGCEAQKIIDEREWNINIGDNSDFDRLRLKSDVSIFRVPNFLKQSRKNEAYVPKMVSLGPYHHTNAELAPMNSHKERAVHRMTTRYNAVMSDVNESNMDFSSRAKQKISKLMKKINKMYEEPIDPIECPPESLTLMLIQDGCFILEILRTLSGENFPVADASKYYEAIFEKNKIDFTGLDILNDMLKLENQIPLDVLRELLKLELDSTNSVEEKLFKVLVSCPASKFYPFKYNMSKLRPSPQPDEQIHHLLGLLHSLIVNGLQRADETNHSVQMKPTQRADETNHRSVNDVRRIPRAVELKTVGIEFERCDGGIRKIEFNPKKGTISLPPINITDHTEVLFCNLIALELCKPSEINYVTCYVSLMDELIDTEEDVALLRDKGIVTNYLGSDKEVSLLFNGLLKGVTTSRNDTFKKLKHDVDAYYRSKMMVWIAELLKQNFSSPWRFLALVAAILVLLFTALQTAYSIFSAYK